MSVQPSEFGNEFWTRWQGHLINGMYPLGRYLGCSDHSGVFLTRSAARAADVAIKLVPTNRALAESQLPRWRRAGGLPHPHLLRLLEWGGCQLDGLPYLYTVMEYADQTLAQLLQHRALTEEEAREMLTPILAALAFLHGRNMVQGQLKPANILVVGDQLKLASDTIRRVGEGTVSTNPSTVYDPPEERHGSSSTAGDIWALGVSLFEALTRRLPAGLAESREAVVLPVDFAPTLRDVLARCLSPSPEDRLSVTGLLAWAEGRSAESVAAATAQPAALSPPAEPGAPVAASPQAPSPPVAQEAARPAPSGAQSPRPQPLLTVTLGAAALLAVGWVGVRVLRPHHTEAPPPAVEASGESLSQTPLAAVPTPEGRPPAAAVPAAKPGGSGRVTSPAAIHEVIPEVPWGARRTIRGHINVWVRLIVDQDGSVLAASEDRTGPSRYFQRLASEAAKKWTFPPVDAPSRRLMQVRFAFSRDGCTGRAVALD